MASTADKNLFVGILALQMDFIHREQLIAAMNAWVLEKSKSLDAILREQGALREDTQALLQALVEKHLELHAGDVEKSLASLSSVGSLREDLKSLADPDIAATISAVAAGHRERDSPATTTVGASTSSGTRFRILRPHAEGGLPRPGGWGFRHIGTACWGGLSDDQRNGTFLIHFSDESDAVANPAETRKRAKRK